MKKVVIGLLILAFIFIQYFYYGSEVLNRDHLLPIEEEFEIELHVDGAMKAMKYTKNTLVNGKDPMIWLLCEDNLFDNEKTSISYSMTHGDRLIETSLPFSLYELFSKTIRIEDEIVIDGISVHLQVLSRTRENTSWIPTYQFTFSYNENLYKIAFRTESDSHAYEANQTMLNENHLEVYINYLKSHIIL